MTRRRRRWGALGAHLPLGVLCWTLAACGSAEPGSDAGPAGEAGAPGEVMPDPPPDPSLPYATQVVSFEPGTDAGFGEDKLPNVVLGPPSGGGVRKGSLDVLSLGKGGTIVLGFDRYAITDGPGPDLVVFENPFWPGGDPTQVYAEPGEVSVSDDGETWATFACDTAGDGAGHFAGCAGVTPTLPYDATATLPIDPAVTGGDVFDLAELGVTTAHFVRIRDVSEHGAAPTAGFDLDAVGIVNASSAQ